METENNYIFSDKYEPLFKVPEGVRYILVKGGRGSGKSVAVSSAVSLSTYDDLYNVLYCRYTMVSAEVSIIPEYKEKLDIFGIADDFEVKSTQIQNTTTGACIYFRGIMVSSGNQIAKLKSIHNVKMWVLDEAQELADEGIFDDVDLSIRTKGAHNVIALVFNPTDVDHWIYRRFYANLPDEDFNGIIGDTAYISTTYFDNYPNLSESFLTQAEKMKNADPDKYDNIFLGHFKQQKEGLIYKNWQKILPEEYPTGLPQWYGNDWGYSDDPDALVRMCYDPVSGTLYVWEVCYQTGLLPRDVARRIAEDGKGVGYSPDYCTTYCDPARPEAIAELRIHYGIDARPGVNRDKAGRIAWLKGFRVKYVGDNIEAEATRYRYKKKAHDASHFSEDPQDGNDHLMDAINYAAVTHLRALGITNDCGEK